MNRLVLVVLAKSEVGTDRPWPSWHVQPRMGQAAGPAGLREAFLAGWRSAGRIVDPPGVTDQCADSAAPCATLQAGKRIRLRFGATFAEGRLGGGQAWPRHSRLNRLPGPS